MKLLSSCSILVSALAVTAAEVNRNFRGNREHHLSGNSTGNHASLNLLQQLETAAGREHRIATEGRLGPMKEAMLALFQAMPKDSAGRIDATGLRYLLRRVFVQRHGWFVEGLGTAGDALNTSPTKVFKQEHVQEVFEDHLNNHGFNLDQAAILAATLESFVHNEAVERLMGAYRILGLSTDSDAVSDEEVTRAMQVYMLMYTDSRLNHSTATMNDVLASNESAISDTPSWLETLGFLDEVRKLVQQKDAAAAASPTSWTTTLKTLEEVANRYGRWQDRECRTLKKQLVSMGDPETGRVPLDRFYEHGLSSSTWLFLESRGYLRELGALDEADPAKTAVIIANYVNSHSNCIASSQYYDVCCIDECGSLLGHLEKQLAAPEAEPKRIAALVANLPSDTVEAPRALSDSLLGRLSEIAGRHGGMVPLHGRLFAQWMHHAYPQECSYPHLSGTLNPSVVDKFNEKTGIPVSADADEMRQLILDAKRSSSPSSSRNDVTRMPWCIEEELFVGRRHEDPDSNKVFKKWAFAAVAAPLSATAVLLLRVNPKVAAVFLSSIGASQDPRLYSV